MISVRFQGKPFNITVIQVYAPTSNAEEAEVEQFCEDLQDLLELTPQKDVLFIIGDWNAKVINLGTADYLTYYGDNFIIYANFKSVCSMYERNIKLSLTMFLLKIYKCKCKNNL